jgi:hypothetical protein
MNNSDQLHTFCIKLVLHVAQIAGLTSAKHATGTTDHGKQNRTLVKQITSLKQKRNQCIVKQIILKFTLIAAESFACPFSIGNNRPLDKYETVGTI